VRSSGSRWRANAFGADPLLQGYVRAGEPHPEAQVPSDWIPSLGAGLGASAGLVLGVGGLVLSTLAGCLSGLVAGHSGTDAGHLGA
jgi:hypothetical protein